MVKSKAWPDSAAHPQSGLSLFLSLLVTPFILRVPLDPAEARSWQSSKSFSHPPTNLLYSLPDLSYWLCLLTILTYSFLFVSWLPPSSSCHYLWLAIASELVSPVSTCSVHLPYWNQSDEVSVIPHWLRVAFQTFHLLVPNLRCECA